MENFLFQEYGKCFLTNTKRILHSKVYTKEEYEGSICEKRVVGKKAFENHKVCHDTFECTKCKKQIRKIAKHLT